jgi:dihydrodipicolinate synthase/N-acetylneuraminate lyase
VPKRYPQAVLVSCELPWDEHQRLMEDAFRAQVRTTLESFNHLYIFGTAGEGYAVTLSQFREVAEVFWEETDRPDVHPMVGVIAMSTAQVVERIASAYQIGFRMFQITLPPWSALSDNETITFFKDVCGSFPDAQFLHYNTAHSKRVLLTEDYQRIEAVVPNLVATKFESASPGETRKLVTQTELQHFLGEGNFPWGCLHGECSLLAFTAPLSPARALAFFELGLTGRIAELFQLADEIDSVVEALYRPVADLPLVDGAYDKILARASGVEMPLRMLSPYEGCDIPTYEACVASLRKAHPEWLE